MLTLTQIQAVDDLQIVSFDVPEWGGEIGIRPLNGTQRDVVTSLSLRLDSEPKIYAELQKKMLMFCLVDDAGTPLVDSKTYSVLMAKNGDVIDRVFRKCNEVSGLSSEAEDEIKGKSEGAKQSPSTAR